MKLTVAHLNTLPQPINPDIPLNYFEKYEGDSDITKCFFQAIILMEPPLSSNEMDYFNTSLSKILAIQEKYPRVFYSENINHFLFSNKDLSDNLEKHLTRFLFLDRTFSSATEVTSTINQIAQDFYEAFPLKMEISPSEILFLLNTLHILNRNNIEFTKDNQNQTPDKGLLNFQAKNGNIEFVQNSMVYGAPKIRERLMACLHLFFSEDKNILNGYFIGLEEPIIKQHDYIMLLNCEQEKYYMGKSSWLYLTSQYKSFSFDNFKFQYFTNLSQPQDYLNIINLGLNINPPNSNSDIISFQAFLRNKFYELDINNTNILDQETQIKIRVSDIFSLKKDFFSSKFTSIFGSKFREFKLRQKIDEQEIGTTNTQKRAKI